MPAAVAAQHRIETLDVLRGCAPLGILAMNIRAMAAPISTYMYPYAILVPYALCGRLVVWWARRLSAPALLAASLALLAVGGLMAVGHGFSYTQMSEADRAAEAAMMMPTAEQAREQIGWMLASYPETVVLHAPAVVMFQTLYFVAFFL